jgi:hypothetical protein
MQQSASDKYFFTVIHIVRMKSIISSHTFVSQEGYRTPGKDSGPAFCKATKKTAEAYRKYQEILRC